MDMLGQLLMQLMNIKQVIHCEPIFYETDLLNYLESYQQPTDDELYQSSLMLQPKKQTDSKRAGKRMSMTMFDRDKII